jgi:SulP family sulfate permease
MSSSIKLKFIFPFLRWFPLPAGVLRADLLAGLTVALVLIPQAMAYAELAGLPPWIGLYAAFLPPILAGLWGSSNHLQTGPGATIALLTASALAPLAVVGSADYVQLASKLAFMIGVIWALAALLRLSFVMNFLSRPVIEGFIHAGGIIIATSQIGKMLGLQLGQGSHYLSELATMLGGLGSVNWMSLTIGLGSLTVMLLGRRYFPKWPAALIVAVAGSAVVWFFGLSDAARSAHPLLIVGAIPAGLPKPVLCVPDGGDALRLLPGALTIAFVGFMEMCSVARGIAARSRQKLNLNQETVGQSVAILGSAFSGGFPVNGSFSRSALNYASGARTGLSAVFTGLFVLIFLLFFTPVFYFLPKTVLAAIIISAVVRLMNFKQLWGFMKVNRADGVAAFGTFFATLAFAPQLEKGILLGASISILMQLYRMMRPHVALLGLHPDGAMRDDPNLPAVRLDGRLFFANAYYFEEQIHAVCERFPSARYVAIVCNGINEIDASGTEMLKDLSGQLQVDGVELLFIGVKHKVIDVMRASGLNRMVGEANFFGTFDHARQEIYDRLPSDLSYTI